MNDKVQVGLEKSTSNKIKKLIFNINKNLHKFTFTWLIAILARMSLGLTFWNSARLKVEGFSIKDSTYFLFEHEFALPIIPFEIAAVLATISEHVFGAMVLLGFMTRYGALGLLGMTLVIQFLVYPDAYILHGMWAVCALILIKFGGGIFSIDHLISKVRGNSK